VGSGISVQLRFCEILRKMRESSRVYGMSGDLRAPNLPTRTPLATFES